MAGSESARQRDLYKYYQPWLDVSDLQYVPVEVSEDTQQPSHRAKSSRDKNLTALAQLAALRLNVKRCLISLIDSNTQIILAEATKSLSLVNDQRHGPDDHLWLGRISLPRKDCVDEHVFGSTYTAKDADGREHSAEALVIPDLRLDDRFKNRAYVTAERSVRFYAGVPLVTRAGFRIGAYAVSDPQPRFGLSVDEFTFMQDAAQTITEHLENIKSSYDRDRGERMVKGLASFIEGLSDLKHQTQHSTTDNNSLKEDSSSDVEAIDAHDSVKVRHNKRKSGSSFVRHPETDVRVKPDTEEANYDQIPAHYTETSAEIPVDTGTIETDVQHIFSRAAKIITTATRSDGCVFFDASSGIFADESLEGDDAGSLSADSYSSGSDTEGIRKSHSRTRRETFSSSRTHSRSVSTSSQTEISNISRPAKILGAALKAKHFEDLQQYELSERDLKRCIRRYPYGKIFYLDEQGHMSSGEEGTEETVAGGGLSAEYGWTSHNKKHRHHKLHHLPQQFLSLVPGVKSVIFLPLFNYSHNRWFAGGFIWSTSRAVTNPEEEMPYLKTFGSTIMSEVASMEALNINRAKTTFIASISHELRSPLHGILGSLEFLEDTMITAYQMSLVGSIETCGRTLLDTIDHLLDYAKINNLNQNESGRMFRRHIRGARRGSADIAGITTSLTAEFNLACLAEEVIEAVFAGQTFRKTRLREGYSQARNAADHMRDLNMDDSLSIEQVIHSGSAKFSGKVFVILEISKADSWWLRSQPGAIRRVIMNIFGNAIKYCNKGTIEAVISMTPRGKSGHNIEIMIKDTGKGMSKDYLQNHLFRAFSQEDSFSYGTGLGLSITKQIVDNLDGKIRVRSQKDVGTHVRVSLPIFPIAAQGDNPDEEMMKAALRCTRGKTICLLSPDGIDTELSDNQLSRLSESMAKTCKEWFEIDFLEGKTMEADADIFFYAEPPPIEHLLAHHAERKVAGKTGKDIVLLIICTNAFEAASLRIGGITHLTSLGRVVEVMSQPVGPRKLAKVLLQSLRQVDQLASPSSSSSSAPGEGRRLAFETAETKDRAAETPWTESSILYDSHLQQHRPSIDTFKWRSDPNLSVKSSSQVAQEQEDLEFGKIKTGDLPGELSFEQRDSSKLMRPATTKKQPSPLQHVQTQTHAPEPPAKHAQESALPLPHVLLVDDNAINLKLLVTFMKKIKLPYTEAVNGLDALQKFQARFSSQDIPRFTFVLMDLQMPIMDGLESTRKIRDFERENKVPLENQSTIIAITGVGSANVQQEAFESGMTQFLTKPVKFKALQALLERGGTVGNNGTAVVSAMANLDLDGTKSNKAG